MKAHSNRLDEQILRKLSISLKKGMSDNIAEITENYRFSYSIMFFSWKRALYKVHWSILRRLRYIGQTCLYLIIAPCNLYDFFSNHFCPKVWRVFIFFFFIFRNQHRKGDFADDQVAHLIASGSESENEEENEEAAKKWRAKFAGILEDSESSENRQNGATSSGNKNEKEFTINADLEEDQGSDCLLSDDENEKDRQSVN